MENNFLPSSYKYDRHKNIHKSQHSRVIIKQVMENQKRRQFFHRYRKNKSWHQSNQCPSKANAKKQMNKSIDIEVGKDSDAHEQHALEKVPIIERKNRMDNKEAKNQGQNKLRRYGHNRKTVTVVPNKVQETFTVAGECDMKNRYKNKTQHQIHKQNEETQQVHQLSSRITAKDKYNVKNWFPKQKTKTKLKSKQINAEPFSGTYDSNQKVLEMVDILQQMKKITQTKHNHSLYHQQNAFIRWGQAQKIDSILAQSKIKSKLSQSTWKEYEKLKKNCFLKKSKIKKNDKVQDQVRDFVFNGLVNQPMTDKKQENLLHYIEQKPQQICNFACGFHNQYEMQIIKNQKLSLTAFENKVSRNQTLKTMFKNMSKTKYFQHFNDADLSDNLFSVAYVSEYKRKNGSSNCRLKKMMNNANCYL